MRCSRVMEYAKKCSCFIVNWLLSTEGDNVNTYKVVNIGEVPTAKMETKHKVQSLAVLRRAATANQANTQLNAMKFFNHLIIFAQKEVNIETVWSMN